MLNPPDVNLIPCCYRNETSAVQIVRISEPVSAYFERAIMPGQIVYFKAPKCCALEIYTAGMASSMHIDTLPCEQLHSLKNAITNSVIANGSHESLKKPDISVKSHPLTKAA